MTEFENFYPRPPRGERPFPICGEPVCCPISIHALREESDAGHVRACQGRTISIHALREESDFRCSGKRSCRKNFYPRPPRGERRVTNFAVYEDATISIHALREESDPPLTCRSRI